MTRIAIRLAGAGFVLGVGIHGLVACGDEPAEPASSEPGVELTALGEAPPNSEPAGPGARAAEETAVEERAAGEQSTGEQGSAERSEGSPSSDETSSPDALSAVGASGAVPEKMARRVRSVLRERHGANVNFDAAHRIEVGEASTVFAFYTYSAYDACVAQASSRAEGREQCRSSLTEAGPCLEAGLVRADIEASPAGRPADWGGEIEIQATRTLPFRCTLDEVEAFKFEDIDFDDRPELFVRYRSRVRSETLRGGVYDYYVEGHLGIFRDDLEPQVLLQVMDHTEGQMDSAMQQLRLVDFEDEDGDGHPELRIETLEWEASGGPCERDAEGRPVPEDDEAILCNPEVERRVVAYVEDAWVVPGPELP
ncbi:MAG: hypothetical protein AAGF12_13080 [Myxococcota bacterium]